MGEITMSSSPRETSCTECGGYIRTEQTEKVCSECGLILKEDTIDTGPDWRSTDDDEESGRRTGAPLTSARHDNGLSTEIGYGNGSEVSGKKQRQFARLRRQHNRARLSSKSERNKVYAYTEIRRIISSLSLPTSLRDQACTLFDSAQSEDLLCGRSLEGFAAAVVYATCRTQSIARTMEEIVDVASADKNELKVAYNALNKELGLPVGPIDPCGYLPRYTSELDLGMAVESQAREYVEQLREENLIGGKNPSGVAAACLYKAAEEEGGDVTQKTLTKIADVSRLTLRSTVSDLESLEA